MSTKATTAPKKETAALAVTSKATAAQRAPSYDISRADETLALAKDLAKFILENKLTHNVQGKEYVNVEGWQYAGSRLGILPIVETVIDLSHDGEIKYSARVTLFDMRSQLTVGAGFAVCSNKENGKKFYAEYAIASMAQTRAIGKAYRNILAWIIRAAGYEPTPAEEMDYATPVADAGSSATVMPDAAPVTPAAAPMTAQTGGKSTPPASAAPGGAPTAAPAASAPAAGGNGGKAKANPLTAYQHQTITLLLQNPLFNGNAQDGLKARLHQLTRAEADAELLRLLKLIAAGEPAGRAKATPANRRLMLRARFAEAGALNMLDPTLDVADLLMWTDTATDKEVIAALDRLAQQFAERLAA